MDIFNIWQLSNFVFIAIFSVFGIYHLASFLVLRHKILFNYFILILGLTLHCSLYIFINNSFSNEVSSIADKMTLVSAMIITFGLLMFTKNYLNIVKSNHPNLSNIYFLFTVIVICLPIVFILNNLTMRIDWLNDFFVILAAITSMSSIFLNIYSGFRLYTAQKFNKYYLFSYTPILLAAILYIGSWFYKRYFDFDFNPILLTSSILVTLQLILFSILISFKFKSIEDENIRIQVETNKMLTIEVDRQTKKLQIAKKELENQNKELAIVNRLKNKLFSLITHDVRGPLNNVTSIIELIEKDLADTELKQVTRKLKSEIHDRVSMINSLLEWSYKQLEGVRLNKQNCDLENVFNSIVKEFERTAEEKEINIELKISCLKLLVDETMLKVILRNLTSNAIKFSNKGQKVILSSQSSTDTIEIGVQDFGLGMNVDWYSKFENEGRHKTKEGTKGEKGTGFGLLIAKDFVEMNGGKMICESEIDKGTKFILRFKVSSNILIHDQVSSL
ncbi:ATP-binding protein [Maribacter sp. X9]|uniref:sensor histidine kinase n=1 Tax=Maribacter sp. X9 TaxID=3402159 RepID=UPI003AF39ED1